ncbi:MAG: SDR family oxidoreductase [Paracoccaceae bacterium]
MKYNWTEADIPALNGKRTIITGTGGLGYDIARMLAGVGCEVILAGRNPEKGAASVAKIKQAVPEAIIRFEQLDLANLENIAAFAERMKGEDVALDILINNAGVMAPPKRVETSDGFELQMGTNYLGHFALTAGLLPLLRKADAPRVVNVSSIAHRNGRIHFDDMQFSGAYKTWPAYGQSKIAMLMFGLELQRQSDVNGWGIISCPAHPGVARTELVANGPGSTSMMGRMMAVFNPLFTHSSAAGALPIVYAATSPDVVGGGYYGPGGFMEMTGVPADSGISKTARNEDTARRLWEVSEQLTGTSFG